MVETFRPIFVEFFDFFKLAKVMKKIVLGLVSSVLAVILLFPMMISNALAKDVGFCGGDLQVTLEYNADIEEVGVIFDKVDGPPNYAGDDRALLCNNEYGGGAGPEWQGTCLAEVSLPEPGCYTVDAYYKRQPGGEPWKYQTVDSTYFGKNSAHIEFENATSYVDLVSVDINGQISRHAVLDDCKPNDLGIDQSSCVD